MARIRTHFSKKLHVAFGVMLLITLALAWYFIDSVRWYQYDIQRIAKSNNVLQGYQQVASLTFRELNVLGEAVERGTPLEDGGSVDSLRQAVSRVRQGIAAEVAFAGNADEGRELETLVEIERLVEALGDANRFLAGHGVRDQEDLLRSERIPNAHRWAKPGKPPGSHPKDTEKKDATGTSCTIPAHPSRP